MKSETEELLDNLTKGNIELQEYAKKYEQQLNAAILVSKLRKSAHLSQAELAKKSQVSKSTIARIENGNMSPTLKTLDKIGKGVGKTATVSYI